MPSPFVCWGLTVFYPWIVFLAAAAKLCVSIATKTVANYKKHHFLKYGQKISGKVACFCELNQRGMIYVV